MKKLMYIITIAVFAFGMIGCNKKEKVTPTPTMEEVTEITATPTQDK